MSKQSFSVLRTLCIVALAGLNVAVIALFTLWMGVDNAAIDRSESGSGFDSSELLPNGNLIWAAAYSSLILMVAVDVCVGVLVVKCGKETS